MIAIDTNVLVRLLTADDKKQTGIAITLIEKHPVFLSKTVLLETEWVLRGCYDIPSHKIFSVFENLLGVSNLVIEDAHQFNEILNLYQHGMDFADAMHLVSAKATKQFFTFDKKMVKKSVQLGLKYVSLL